MKLTKLISSKTHALGLFGKLYIAIALSSVALIWLVQVLSDYTETKFSTISKIHQQELLDLATKAEELIKHEELKKLDEWKRDIEKKENTWLAVIRANPEWLIGKPHEELLKDKQRLLTGRSIEYPIHLYYNYNPIMRLSLGDTGYSLMIQLPQRMRPGAYWGLLNSIITMVLPIMLVAALSYIIYRHIISPLQKLQQATQRFSDGEYQVRTGPSISKRHDELSDLAISFDDMADRIGNLLMTQRQLIQDISHELRTPITRIKLVLSKPEKEEVIDRVEQEINGMQALMEDTLTLSWLDTEKPKLNQESVDVSLLIESIAEDARFEYPSHELKLLVPDSMIINGSNHRTLGQALENVIRNAHKYSGQNTTVNVQVHLFSDKNKLAIKVEDQGPGVPEEDLEKIFKPFYRGDKSRANNIEKGPDGYGLGLALSKRQVVALGGDISASNIKPDGLCMTITLPIDSKEGIFVNNVNTLELKHKDD